MHDDENMPDPAVEAPAISWNTNLKPTCQAAVQAELPKRAILAEQGSAAMTMMKRRMRDFGKTLMMMRRRQKMIEVVDSDPKASTKYPDHCFQNKITRREQKLRNLCRALHIAHPVNPEFSCLIYRTS